MENKLSLSPTHHNKDPITTHALQAEDRLKLTTNLEETPKMLQQLNARDIHRLLEQSQEQNAQLLKSQRTKGG